MSIRHCVARVRYLLLPCLLFASLAHAEPYLAIQQGFKCSQCHVNPTGGGQRNAFGDVFAQTLLPQRHIDTGTDVWTGALAKFLSVGGDLRFTGSYRQVPGVSSRDEFDLDQARVYIEASVIPDRLLVYVDELVAPGGALNREAYGMYWSAKHDWYVKAGQMYLPFGIRIEDQTAFIETATGINMTNPDQGVEFGWLRGPWDTQFAVSNGTAGASEDDNGKQYSGQLIFVQSRWRVGAAANFNDADAGDKSSYGLFAGLRTGPIAWLAQGELVDDKSIANGGGKAAATLVEGNWLIKAGNNLKVTGEFLDPNRNVGHDTQTRWSVLYELTPIQFVQVRAGVRYSDGIPQTPVQHTRLYFVQVHGFF
jgi:hypothetical protein